MRKEEAMMTGTQAARRLRTFIQVSLFATLALVLFGVTAATLFAATGTDQKAKEPPLDKEVQKEMLKNVGSGLIAAGIAASVSAIAAGVAVAYVGSAAVGAVSEKPEVFGRTIIFVALGEGIAVLGLVIAIMILTTVQKMLRDECEHPRAG
jgi:F0F1-type ATP synthase membrane subunit c/vacuolar-type H+-ATPase subunit K